MSQDDSLPSLDDIVSDLLEVEQPWTAQPLQFSLTPEVSSNVTGPSSRSDPTDHHEFGAISQTFATTSGCPQPNFPSASAIPESSTQEVYSSPSYEQHSGLSPANSWSSLNNDSPGYDQASPSSSYSGADVDARAFIEDFFGQESNSSNGAWSDGSQRLS